LFQYRIYWSHSGWGRRWEVASGSFSPLNFK